MRAVVCREYGPPAGLRVEEREVPTPGPGEVAVDVHAAAVNFPDLLILADRYQVSVEPPFVPGSELAGVVCAAGEGVPQSRVGERVFGACLVGAFAERVALPATSVTPIPRGIDFRSAAAFGIAYETAYHALRSAARLRPDESLLVLGAAGGVGLAAVELGRALGARVIAAASSEAKLAVCRERGACGTIDYAAGDLKARVAELTGGRGVDVVVDPVGGEPAQRALRSTAWRGRYVSVGFASGTIPRVPLNVLLLRGSTVIGFNIGSFVANEPAEARRNRAEVLGLLRDGTIRPHVSAVHPLEECARGLADVAERRAVGKVVIEIRPG